MSILPHEFFRHLNASPRENNVKEYNLIVIGGGPSGMGAAISAYDRGERSILIIERGSSLGGVLNSCLQDGFGFDTFKRSLTGQEYVSIFAKGINERYIDTLLNTTVLSISANKEIEVVSPKNGVEHYKAKAIVFASGAREKPRGSLNIVGSRPRGVYVSGAIQKMLNDNEKLAATNAVIFGSDDVGLSLAHRLLTNGVKIKAVVEPSKHLFGSFYNKEKSLDSYDVPLLLSHKVKKVLGNEKLEGVVVEDTSKIVGDNSNETTINCDLLIISVGLIPDTELLSQMGVEISSLTSGPIVNDRFETSLPGVFVTGNALFIHDTADLITEEGFYVGKKAVQYIQNSEAQNYFWEQNLESLIMNVKVKGDISYAVPQIIDVNKSDDNVKIFFRVKEEIHDRAIKVYLSGNEYQIIKKNVLHPNMVYSLLLSSGDIVSRTSDDNSIIIEV